MSHNKQFSSRTFLKFVFPWLVETTWFPLETSRKGFEVNIGERCFKDTPPPPVVHHQDVCAKKMTTFAQVFNIGKQPAAAANEF